MPFIIDDLMLAVPMIITGWRALRAVLKDKGAAATTQLSMVTGEPLAEGSILNVRGIAKLTPAERSALLKTAEELAIPVDSLAAVIASESGWNPAAMNPLPAAGLIQLTAGARLPGFDSADTVRTIVGLDVEEQLEFVVAPFYRRFGSKAQGADPGQLYMLNFLPGVAGEPETKVLGVAAGATAPSGETADSKLLASSSLSLGSIYKQNPGFDPSKKGYFTIGDVYAHIAKQVAAAGGKRVTVDGEIIDEVKTAGGCGAGVPMPPGFDDQAMFEAELWPAQPPVDYAPLQPMASFQMPQEQPLPEPSQELQPFGLLDTTVAFEQPLYGSPEPAPVPEGFEGAYEIPDASFDEETATAGGPGWGETVDPRDVVRRAQGPAGPTPEQTAVIKRGIKAAVLNDEHEPIGWSEVAVGNLRLVVSNSPIAVQGLRLPTSLDDAIAIGNKIGALPITPAISDARFVAARKVYAEPLADPRGALYDDPGQIVKYNERIGPIAEDDFVDGFWKELVVVPGLVKDGRGSMAQYGFKDSDKHMFEHGGPSNHDRHYKDYSDTPTYVSRRATRDGVEIDLLDEYAAGGPLGGPLPEWLIERLRSGEAGA